MEEKGALKKRNVPIEPKLYHQFKQICVGKNLMVKREVMKMMKAYIDQHEKEKRKQTVAVNE